MAAWQPGTAVDIAAEQAIMDELQTRLSCSGSQQDVIAQLRQLNLDDGFWMYLFKVVPCSKSYSHKWSNCCCAHVGETARRRDPRTHSYKAVLCPLAKAKKTCPLGDACSYAHNVFETWLHPARYKTRLCSFGRSCNRPICFFAHTAEELRCVPNADDGKELDEREYLLQLMLAQDGGSGLLQHSASSHLSHAASSQLPLSHSNSAQLPSVGPPLHAASGELHASLGLSGLDLGNLSMHMQDGSTGGGLGSLGGWPGDSAPNVPSPLGRQNTNAAAAAAAAAANSLSDLMSAADRNMLLSLQEALAGVGLSVDGGASAAALNNAQAASSRLSDPGMQGTFPLPPMPANANTNQQSNLNRISDSGKGLGSVSPKSLAALSSNLEALLPLVTSALAQQQQQQQGGGEGQQQQRDGATGGNGNAHTPDGRQASTTSTAGAPASSSLGALARTSSSEGSGASGSPPASEPNSLAATLQQTQQQIQQLVEQGSLGSRSAPQVILPNGGSLNNNNSRPVAGSATTPPALSRQQSGGKSGQLSQQLSQQLSMGLPGGVALSRMSQATSQQQQQPTHHTQHAAASALSRALSSSLHNNGAAHLHNQALQRQLSASFQRRASGPMETVGSLNLGNGFLSNLGPAGAGGGHGNAGAMLNAGGATHADLLRHQLSGFASEAMVQRQLSGGGLQTQGSHHHMFQRQLSGPYESVASPPSQGQNPAMNSMGRVTTPPPGLTRGGQAASPLGMTGAGPQPAASQQGAGQGNMGNAAPGTSPSNTATINKIVNELQEQGMAGSKEQLVASLSQLLVQLLQ